MGRDTSRCGRLGERGQDRGFNGFGGVPVGVIAAWACLPLNGRDRGIMYLHSARFEILGLRGPSKVSRTLLFIRRFWLLLLWQSVVARSMLEDTGLAWLRQLSGGCKDWGLRGPVVDMEALEKAAWRCDGCDVSPF